MKMGTKRRRMKMDLSERTMCNLMWRSQPHTEEIPQTVANSEEKSWGSWCSTAICWGFCEGNAQEPSKEESKQPSTEVSQIMPSKMEVPNDKVCCLVTNLLVDSFNCHLMPWSWVALRKSGVVFFGERERESCHSATSLELRNNHFQ